MLYTSVYDVFLVSYPHITVPVDQTHDVNGYK